MAETLNYKATTVAPAGRNKYGNYYAAGNITRTVVSTTYGGNSTTTTIADTGGTEDNQGNVSFYCILSKANVTFDALDLIEGAQDSTTVVAYRGYDKATTLICDMDKVSATTEDGIVQSLEVPADSGLTGVPSGITYTISDNGTSAATINFYANSLLTGTTGTIQIPVVIYKRNTAIPVGDDIYDWWDSMDDCEQVWLDFVWNVNRAASSTYVMDLSNERAGVNVSAVTAQGDILYPASISALTCTATTHMGTELVPNVVYSVFTNPQFHARGNFGINPNNGVMYWESNFNFDGPTLPIDITASLSGNAIAAKTMTIEKNYPGAEGQAAITKWIVTDYSEVKYDPNSGELTPTAVTAYVMKQVGGDEPFVDTGETIYYWYSSYQTPSVLPATGATAYQDEEYIMFGLKNSNDVFYELETVHILWEGENGRDGTSGKDGTNAWYMTMTNDNASINCDSSGNILTNAVKPSCQVKLFYGDSRRVDATYSISANTPYTGITTGNSNGILTITCGNNFKFNTDVLELTVTGSSSGGQRDIKVMTIVKSYAGQPGSNGDTPYISGGTWWIGGVDTGIEAGGEDGDTPYIGANGNWWIGTTDTGVKAEGQDAVTYWLNPSFTEVIFDRTTSACNPTSITCEKYKQIGENDPVTANDATIKYSWQNRSNNNFTTESNFPSTGLNITTANCVSYRRLRLRLLAGFAPGTQVDMEDIDILMDGKDGKDGVDGTNGTNGQNAWYMTMTNDNASINCDASGHILTNAVKPSCKVKLYCGDTRRTDATYAISGNTPYTGVSLSTSNGIGTLTFGSNFNFNTDVLELSVSGTSSGEQRDVKVMTIIKSYAGAPGTNGDTPYIGANGNWWIGSTDTGITAEGEDGDTPYIGANGNWWIGNTDTGIKAEGKDAITYWLDPSYTEIIYDRNTNTCNPTSITCDKYKQVGENAPTTASDATIKYSWQYRNTNSFTTESTLPSTGLSITTGNCSTYRRLRLRLYINTSTQVDMEDIDILMDGKDGVDGQGRAGAAIRGPYDYYEYSASTRCWCAGASSSTCTDCDKWIDVIYKDGTYYYCSTTYYGKLSPWSNVSSYWTAGESFDFIATKLLLAQNASIDFLTGNELYLRDANGNITAGAAGGNGINFWAGADSPSNAPFQVDVSGNVYANKGVFAGYIQYPYTFVSNLNTRTVSYKKYGSNTSSTGYVGDNRAYLVSDTTNIATSKPYFFLPFPTSEWNGFTYDIIVEPQMTRSDGYKQWLDVVVSGATGTTSSIYDRGEIYCYAFTEVRNSREFVLTGGRYQITCMPKHDSNNNIVYNWAITNATGGLWRTEDASNTECLSTLVATAYNTDPLYKLTTYTGSTSPSGSVRNPNLTMFIQK